VSLRIARLRLRLPAGYAPRAGALARSVAEATARVGLTESRSLDTLSLGPIRVGAGASDADIADAVARRLSEGLKRRP
jgi:hypothetical protein